MDSRSLRVTSTDPVKAGRRDVVISMPRDDLLEKVSGRVITRNGREVVGVAVRPMRDLFRVPYPEKGKSRTADMALGKADRSVEPMQTFSAGLDSVFTDVRGYFELRRVPREGVYLRLDGDTILPVSHYLSDSGLPEMLEIVVPVRCHLQVDLEEGLQADHLAVLDARGVPLSIDMFLGNERITKECMPLIGGRSHVLAVPDTAETLVLYRADTKVLQLPLHLIPGKLNIIRP
jgi:hypothetical protein